jgi:hypothetical protein
VTHTCFDFPEGYEYAEKAWAYWIPFLERIIAQAPTDCVRNWLIALRYTIYPLPVLLWCATFASCG